MSCEQLDTTDADVIPRSVVGQEFRAYKNMLSLASPVFRNMFTFPQPPSPEPPSLPVVDMCETGNVLDMFLRCLYPVSKPTVEDFDLLEALIAAAEKYETNIILHMVGLWLVIPENLKRDPLRVYTIVCSSAVFRGQAKVAAKCMTPSTVAEVDWNIIAQLSIVDHHRLVVYLVNREKEARHMDYSSYLKSRQSQCTCTPSARIKLTKNIKRALTDAFVSDPSLTMERAVVLTYKQLTKVDPCRYYQGCWLVIHGEECTEELMKRLMEISDNLWC